MMAVRIAYAEPGAQWELPRQVAVGTTVAELLADLRSEDPFSRLQLSTIAVGIWGAVAARDQVLKPGDRLELYRPLQVDPKTARRRRAESPR